MLNNTSGTFFNNLSNNLMSDKNFNGGLVNTIGNNLIVNSAFINNLASTLSNTQNSYYTSLVGPPGSISDTKSIYNSLTPFTIACTTGNNGMVCSTTFNTVGPMVYNLGPTTGTFNTNYNFGKNAVLQIGDWKLSQSPNGNLQFINTQNSSSGIEVSNATIGNTNTVNLSNVRRIYGGPENMIDVNTGILMSNWFSGNNVSVYGGVLTHTDASRPGNQGYRLGPFH